jgi:hypothetical protein
VRRKLLVLCLDAGEQLGDERSLAELISGESSEECILAVEGGRHISPVGQQSPVKW